MAKTACVMGLLLCLALSSVLAATTAVPTTSATKVTTPPPKVAPSAPKPAGRTPPAAAPASGPTDCLSIKGCDTCSQRNARSAVRCSKCLEGFVMRNGACTNCAVGYAGKDINGQKFEAGCGMCDDGVAASGPMSTSQCKKCPSGASPNADNSKCGCPAGMRMMNVLGISSCQPCAGMTYSAEGNSASSCRTCTRGQVPNTARDSCVDRTNPDALKAGAPGSITPPANPFANLFKPPTPKTGTGAAASTLAPKGNDPLSQILSGIQGALQGGLPNPAAANGLTDPNDDGTGSGDVGMNLQDAMDAVFFKPRDIAGGGGLDSAVQKVSQGNSMGAASDLLADLFAGH